MTTRFQFELWRLLVSVVCLSILFAIVRAIALGSDVWFPLAISALAIGTASVWILIGRR